MTSQIQHACSSHSVNVTNNVAGESLSLKNQALDTAAKVLQSFEPVSSICAFLNAFHCYADEPGRYVEACHYCTHVNEGKSVSASWRYACSDGCFGHEFLDLRQCLIYDAPEKNARLIGVEYMISPKLYDTLDSEERKLWHSHVFEVKSGMLIMPSPMSTSGIPVPKAIWEKAELAEMQEVVGWYGKTFHFWQVDRGDKLPLGMPRLMGSFTERESLPDFDTVVGDRDKRYGEDHRHKAEIRKDIPLPELHPDADAVNVNSARSRKMN